MNTTLDNNMTNTNIGSDGWQQGWDDLIPTDPYLRDAHWIYLLLGGFICAFGLLSHYIKGNLYMSEAM
ncbi:hypothetical protein HDU76_007387, partial [Blyttiomyces sp. JEL0837]